MFETIIKPINQHTSCRQPLSEDAAKLLILLHDEAAIGETSFPENGPHLIIENALRTNSVTAHPVMTVLIMECMRGNPGYGHALTYALACEAYRQRTLRISSKIFIDTFPLGLPNAEQLSEYWDVYKAGMARASSENKENMLRPSIMLHDLAAAGIDCTELDDEQILKAYLNLDDPDVSNEPDDGDADQAGDENYALPADND